MITKRPSIKQIEYFLAVAESASFRQAAERLRVSQPTLTSQIGLLEKQLGCELFERSRRGTHLSPIGRELMPLARQILAEVDTFVDAGNSETQGQGGTYRLGVTPTLGPYLLPYLLPEVHSRYSQLRFFVREADPRSIETGLINGDYDLTINTLPLNSDTLTVIPIAREPIKLILPIDHRLSMLDEIKAEDLRGEDVLSMEEHHLFFQQVEQICRKFGARVLRDYEGTSLDAVRQMVVMGLGIAFLPALYVRSEIHAASGLKVADISGESIVRIHALVWRPSAPARTFFKRLADDIKDILVRDASEILLPVE